MKIKQTAKWDGKVWIVEGFTDTAVQLQHPFDDFQAAIVPKELVRIHNETESQKQLEAIQYFKSIE